jgi:tetratricopeptide (TPR) repeat protein
MRVCGGFDLRLGAALLLSTLLAACATPELAKPPEGLFSDQLFAASSERIRAEDVFALSPEMKHYLTTDIATQVRLKGTQQGLYDALYSKRQLQLDYDSAMTRNAAEAFAARTGNCLSLVIMTAAFAKPLGVPVRYQSAYSDESWGRDNDTYFFIGHINLSLGRRSQEHVGFGQGDADHMTIDFIPPLEIRALRTYEIPEQTVVAMYFNNKAAEALTAGRLDDAYAWAKAAIVQDPGFGSSYNTLGVVYLRHGNLLQAEKVLSAALERDPNNTRLLSNLAAVFNAEGRVADAAALTRKLEQIDPNPAFSFFNRGLKAMREHDYAAARDWFIREVNRQPYYHEFHFWLASAYVQLGEIDKARKELNLALEYSTTRNDHDIYAAKLERIKSPPQLQ